MWKIYKITNKTYNEDEECYKAYIGITLKSIEERFKEHCLLSSGCKAFRNAIIKYGRDNWTLEILEDNIKTESEAFEKEEFHIEKYQTLTKEGKGYNLMRGSSGRKIINGKLKCYGVCKLLKNIKNFSKDKNTESGYCFICKSCIREYKLQNKERIRLVRREWGIAHKEERKQKDKIISDKNSLLSLEDLRNLTPLKRCINCKIIKNTIEFSRTSKNIDGFREYCKICDGKRGRERYLKNKIAAE